jgi:hypothetical protein
MQHRRGLHVYVARASQFKVQYVRIRVSMHACMYEGMYVLFAYTRQYDCLDVLERVRGRVWYRSDRQHSKQSKCEVNESV